MRPNQTMIASVVLTLQLGWALPGCAGTEKDASTAGASGASTGGDQASAASGSGGSSAGSAEPTGGASSGAGGIATTGGDAQSGAGSSSGGGEGESAGSSNAGAGGAGSMCIMPGGDLKTCVLDQENKRDAATACNPGAPNQCQDRITNDCGCEVAVNDADSPEVACYLATLAERPCGLCTPEPCAQPLGQCEVARAYPNCR
jgi:hypothetical protein